MSTTVRWMVSTSASAFHAAEALAQGRPLADSALAAALAESVSQFHALIEESGIAADTFWGHVTALAAGIHNNRELANVALTKTIGRSPRQSSLVDPFSAAVMALEHAYDSFSPRSNHDLELRSGPLREQWEARGPGLLVQTGKLVEPELLVDQADVLLVHPARGGAGHAHVPYNSVRIEAVLANPHAELPEVVRLAWLLAQLNHDLPLYQGSLSRARAVDVGALALIPATLTAAESVELARCDSATLALAIDAWNMHEAGVDDVAKTLDEWWQVYQGSRPPWAIALAALDRMLIIAKEES